MTKEEAMRIWDALKTTDPKYTKKVEFGRKFTSINSQWQLQRMTENFGPIGEGWGYTVEHRIERITDEYVLAIADVLVWWGPTRVGYGPVRGMSPILERGKNGLHYDDDAGKKAMTDALTKGLSHLGLSADVFLGLFDDNKYVRKVAEQFAEGDRPAQIMHGSPALVGREDDWAEEAVRDGLAKSTTSTYDTERRKAAEKFVATAIDRFAFGAGEVRLWYDEKFSPKRTNRDVAHDLEDRHPDLYAKLEAAAEEVRLR